MLTMNARLAKFTNSAVHWWPKLLFNLLASLLFILLSTCVQPADAQVGGDMASEPNHVWDAVGSAPLLNAAQLDAGALESAYWIWVVLPRLFPEYLTDAGGYLSLGFRWRASEEVPIGISKIPPTRLTQSRQRLDCMGCHQTAPGTTSAQTLVDKNSVYVQTAFSHRIYEDFLRRCAEDPRFDAEYLIPAIRYNHPISWLTEQRYRYQLIPEARKTFLASSNIDKEILP